MWPFSNKTTEPGIKPSSIKVVNGITEIDVRGQTCPGYLLAINKAVETLDKGTTAKLLITYPPCGEDVKAWCRERKIEYIGLIQEEGMWVINIKK
ncbi:MAG: sulfurtransferase TusA family protein [Gammaproteobacteria bacterium]|nr:sulfurtransferase TusA family protein [Gammaproteobacteria bacterium]